MNYSNIAKIADEVDKRYGKIDPSVFLEVFLPAQAILANVAVDKAKMRERTLRENGVNVSGPCEVAATLSLRVKPQYIRMKDVRDVVKLLKGHPLYGDPSANYLNAKLHVLLDLVEAGLSKMRGNAMSRRKLRVPEHPDIVFYQEDKDFDMSDPASRCIVFPSGKHKCLLSRHARACLEVYEDQLIDTHERGHEAFYAQYNEECLRNNVVPMKFYDPYHPASAFDFPDEPHPSDARDPPGEPKVKTRGVFARRDFAAWEEIMLYGGYLRNFFDNFSTDNNQHTFALQLHRDLYRGPKLLVSGRWSVGGMVNDNLSIGPEGIMKQREANVEVREDWDFASHTPQLVFLATRPIKKGEELLFLYGDGYWKVMWKKIFCEHATISATYVLRCREMDRTLAAQKHSNT